MIRRKPAKEVTLTSAPGWEEAEGRPSMRRVEDDIAEVEVIFRGRRSEPREIPVIVSEAEVLDAEDGIIQGRYALDSAERSEGPRPKTEEEHARSTMGYFDYLKWQLSQIAKRGRNKDAKVIDKFKSLW